MASKQCPKRIGLVLQSCSRSASKPPGRRQWYASAATAASNLPADVKSAIEKEAYLPTPDPLPDSQTARLTEDRMHYMVPTYVRPPPMFQKGEGCYLWDVENRRYLDFTAGIAVNALGHSDPEVAKVLYQQANTLLHASNLYHNPWTGELSKLLVEKTVASGGMNTASKAFICNSGSEANEAAIKFARKFGRATDPSGRKHEIVSFENSFHGRTMGALSATPNPKYQTPFSPMLPGFHYATLNSPSALDLITPHTCAVLIEPIQGEGGVHSATPDFLAALRSRCNETSTLLIYDEIQCGLSRTGTLWAHSILPPSSHPDILTTAKALGNGFPVGATLVSEAVASRIATGDHGTTFGGSPLASRVAHHVLTRLADPQLQQEVRAKEKLFRAGIARIAERYPGVVTEVRGRGLILGVQLSRDPAPVITAARERGLLVITAGKDTLRLVPPLVVSEAEIEEGLEILDRAMHEVFGKGTPYSRTEGQQEMG